MGYARGSSTQPSATVLSVEQARRRNAELRLALVPVMAEYAQLTAEKAELDAKVEAMRRDVTAARKKLSRQIRDLDVIRVQSERIASGTEQTSTLPAPQYGGREGLQAAADEIEAYEGKPGAKLGTVRRRTPRHGTSRKYGTGCRCEECLGWRERKSAQELVLVRRRREREIADALRAHEETAA